MQTILFDALNLQLAHFLNVVTELPGSGVGHSAGAGSPFTNYTAKVTVFVLLVGVLVTVLLGGAVVILNLTLLSKRPEDLIGKRTPSEPGFLKHGLWPQVPYERGSLPAEEEEDELKDEDKKTA